MGVLARVQERILSIGEYPALVQPPIPFSDKRIAALVFGPWGLRSMKWVCEEPYQTMSYNMSVGVVTTCIGGKYSRAPDLLRQVSCV